MGGGGEGGARTVVVVGANLLHLEHHGDGFALRLLPLDCRAQTRERSCEALRAEPVPHPRLSPPFSGAGSTQGGEAPMTRSVPQM